MRNAALPGCGVKPAGMCVLRWIGEGTSDNMLQPAAEALQARRGIESGQSGADYSCQASSPPASRQLAAEHCSPSPCAAGRGSGSQGVAQAGAVVVHPAQKVPTLLLAVTPPR